MIAWFKKKEKEISLSINPSHNDYGENSFFSICSSPL